MNFKGIWTALVTPFDDHGKIDFDAFKKLIHRQIEAGVAGLVPCGTTGETPTLSHDEKKELILTTLKEAKGSKAKIIAGTGSNDTRASVEFSKWACDQGADAVLAVVPYYNKPSQEGLIAHFEAIANAIDKDVVLYNVPGRTVTSLAPDTVAKLSRHPRINSIKEATGDMSVTSEIIDQVTKLKSTIQILSGDDISFLSLLAGGAIGTISVASNVIPREMVAMCNAALDGKLAEAQKIHQRYYPLFRDLFIEPNPVPAKAALHHMGLCKPHLRLPLTPMKASTHERLIATLKNCEVKR